MLSWDDWLNERVNGAGTKRRTMIWGFVNRGLIPFLQHYGYAVEPAAQDLGSRIATGLYINQGLSTMESNWKFARENQSYRPEDLARYYFVIDDDEWEGFWQHWRDWDDVSLDTWRGEDRRMDIQFYAWTQLNLELSHQTQIVDEFLGISEEDEDGWGGNDGRPAAREDTYLQEARESGQWDGYRK